MDLNEKLKESVLVYMDKSDQSTFEVKEISEGLNLTGFADFKQLVQALADLEREGRIFLTKQGKFKLTRQKPVMSGRFRANDRGFGFVEIEGEDKDVYIPPHRTNYAMEGDTVSIEVTKEASAGSDRGDEGQVVAILEHNVSQLVGEFIAYDDKGVDDTGFYGFVEPQDKRLSSVRVFIEKHGIRPANESIVVVEITQYPTQETPRGMQGLVKKVLGYKNDPGIDILSVVYKHGIPTEFPKEVMEQAERVPDRVQPEEWAGRRDLTQETIVTIDGEDAKDLDDAIQVEILENGHFRLGVHIADVSHYVTDKSPIDKEAFERGTSVYLTDRVIPMLPQLLSNGICSLNPNVDRLTLTCEMEFDQNGERVGYEIYPSVIRSTARMTYTAVNQILTEQDEAVRAEYASLVPMFEAMGKLHHILEEKRRNRGAVDFDTKEAKIIVDEEGHPLDIEVRERGVGERLIESFMLAANETVSEHYTKKHLPILYRIHEQPDAERMQSFMEFVSALGINMKGTSENVSPKALQKVLKKVHDKPEEAVVSMLMLRSMKQAKYDVEPIGHYGLAAEFYSHFTSPIRRYPDLILHRLIHYYDETGSSKEDKKFWSERLPEIAEQSSITERRAVDAERETDDMKKAEYMETKVGEIFDGIIVSITGFGMFIQLPNTIEGLIHISNMTEDYFEFDQRNLMMIGQHTGIVYRIGESIKVRVTAADGETREVDFEIVGDPNAPVREKPKKSFRSKKGSDKKDAGRREDHRKQGKNNQSGRPHGEKKKEERTSGKKNSSRGRRSGRNRNKKKT